MDRADIEYITFIAERLEKSFDDKEQFDYWIEGLKEHLDLLTKIENLRKPAEKSQQEMLNDFLSKIVEGGE